MTIKSQNKYRTTNKAITFHSFYEVFIYFFVAQGMKHLFIVYNKIIMCSILYDMRKPNFVTLQMTQSTCIKVKFTLPFQLVNKYYIQHEHAYIDECDVNNCLIITTTPHEHPKGKFQETNLNKLYFYIYYQFSK